jgi:hypothetical protein
VGTIGNELLTGCSRPRVHSDAPETRVLPALSTRRSGRYPTAVTVNSFGLLPASTRSAMPELLVFARPPAGVASGETGGPGTYLGGIKRLPPVVRTIAWGTGFPVAASRTSITAGTGDDPARHPCSNTATSPSALVRRITFNGFLLIAYSRGEATHGGGGIRTREGADPLLVFKTSAFNRSATPP